MKSTVLRSTVQYNMEEYITAHYSTEEYNTEEYSTVQYRRVQYSTVQYRRVQYSTVLGVKVKIRQKEFFCCMSSTVHSCDG